MLLERNENMRDKNGLVIKKSLKELKGEIEQKENKGQFAKKMKSGQKPK